MRLKKIALAAVVSSMALATSASAADFTDTRGHWAQQIINDLADRGIVNGVSDTEFNPDGTVTRAEFLRMALGAGGIEDTAYRSGECLDVNANDWFAPCVQSALDKGLIPEGMVEDYSVEIVTEGDNSRAVYSGKFNALSSIKREEMAYIAQEVYQYSLGGGDMMKLSASKDLDFGDVKAISPWAFDGVKHAYANDLVSGMDDGTFRPQDTATRAQAATIIRNMIDR